MDLEDFYFEYRSKLNYTYSFFYFTVFAKILNLAKFSVLIVCDLLLFLVGLVINYAILVPFIFLHSYFFFDRILNYFLFCYF